MILNDLIGLKIIQSFFDGDSILLEIDGEPNYIGLVPEGLCCAYCYICHVDSSEVLFDSTINEIEQLETNDLSSDPDYAIESWGIRIHTTKGICNIEMRVEHNGYYGGDLEPKILSSIDTEKLRKLEDF